MLLARVGKKLNSYVSCNWHLLSSIFFWPLVISQLTSSIENFEVFRPLGIQHSGLLLAF